jgi:hypothetical protein
MTQKACNNDQEPRLVVLAAGLSMLLHAPVSASHMHEKQAMCTETSAGHHEQAATSSFTDAGHQGHQCGLECTHPPQGIVTIA